MGVIEALVNLLAQPLGNRIEQGGDFDFQLTGMNRSFAEKPREQQAQKTFSNRGDRTFRREIFAVQVVDATEAGVRSNKLIG